MKYDRPTRDLVADVFKYTVGMSIIIGFFLVFYKLVEAGDYKEAVISLIASIGGSVVTIVAYEFGSSRSSQRKDELRNQQNENIGG